ncbi:MAG: DUF5819 family protein [Motilibacteraceae bacterium]
MPWPLRITAVAAGAVVVALTLSTLVYVAPPSVAQRPLRPLAARVLEPLFWQNWQLFAPDPATAVSEVYLQVRLARPDGSTVETAPVEIEGAIDRAPRQQRLDPGRLPAVLLALDRAAYRYQRARSAVEDLPQQQRAAALRRLDESSADTFSVVQRLMSERADLLYPGRHVLAVRVDFGDRPIVPFDQRAQASVPDQRPDRRFRRSWATPWLPYVPGVGR